MNQIPEAPAQREYADSIAQAIGIPAEEMSSNVWSAVVRLLDELERLRLELGETRSRIAYLERLADQDSLTPVASRRAFMRELGRSIAYSARHDVPSSVVYLDLNKMKQINDRYGHARGDAALLHVANTLLKRVRNSDLISRLGGDEFGLIMPNSDETGAMAKADKAMYVHKRGGAAA